MVLGRRAPFRISPADPSRFGVLIKKLIRTIVRKPKRLEIADSQHSLGHLPPEIVLLIAEVLELHDVASLCLVSRNFNNILGTQLKSMKHDASQKLEFLRKLDPLNPKWLLCHACARYHPRSKGECNVKNGLEVLDNNIFVSPTAVRLVKRRKHYNRRKYGRSRWSLSQCRRLGTWNIVTCAVWDTDSHLVLRMTSQFGMPTALPSNYTRPFSAIAFCRCDNQELMSLVYNTCDAIVQEIQEMHLSARHQAHTLRDDIQCPGCGDVYEVLRRYVQTYPNPNSRHWYPACSYRVEVSRYHDLGTADDFNDFPHEAGSFSPRASTSNLAPVILDRDNRVLRFARCASALADPKWRFVEISPDPWVERNAFEINYADDYVPMDPTMGFSSSYD